MHEYSSASNNTNAQWLKEGGGGRVPEPNEEGAFGVALQQLDGLRRGHVTVEPTVITRMSTRMSTKRGHAHARTTAHGSATNLSLGSSEVKECWRKML
jgi:hypothetical protein